MVLRSEQGHPPQRQSRPRIPGHDRAQGEPDESAGTDDRHDGQGQLDEECRQQAEHETAGPQVEGDVEPGVAAQQASQHHQADDQHLATAPGGPRCHRERGQQGQVKADPCAPPATRPVVARKRDREHAYPAGQGNAAPDDGRQHDGALPLRHRPAGWERRVHGCDRAHQLGPLPRTHPPEFDLVEHANTSSNGNDPLVPLFPDCALTILRESAGLAADRLWT